MVALAARDCGLLAGLPKYARDTDGKPHRAPRSFTSATPLKSASTRTSEILINLTTG
jgi:hypothetical protein